MSDILDSFTTDDLARMRDTAYREAARCWQEYHAAFDGPREISQLLHDSAWSAEHHWRKIHDAYMTRAYPAAVQADAS